MVCEVEVMKFILCSAFFLAGLWFGADYTQFTAGYNECTAELPRNQDCKLIAVPEVSNANP